MKQNEIIEMAGQAGLHVATDVNWMPIIGLEYAEKLIALARADEREACAKVCEGRIGGAVLDDQWMLGFKAAMRQCATAIRARGQA
jgi:hypothetical protein